MSLTPNLADSHLEVVYELSVRYYGPSWRRIEVTALIIQTLIIKGADYEWLAKDVPRYYRTLEEAYNSLMLVYPDVESKEIFLMPDRPIDKITL